MLKPWWQQFPGRLEYEVEELKRIGAVVQRNERLFQEGRVELVVQVVLGGEELKLNVRFPDLYPYFRFEIIAADLELSHHQNPFLKNLCLINSPTENWRTTDTVASFIRERLPLVLQTGRSDSKEEAAGLEEHQAEPITTFYRYQKDSIVFVDSSWTLDPSIRRGQLILGVDPRGSPILRGAVHEIQRGQGTVVARANPAILRLHALTIPGRWIRTTEPVREDRIGHFLDILYSHDDRLREPKWRAVGDSELDVIGVIFPEETRWRGGQDGWVFVVRVRRDRKGFRPGRYWDGYLARPGWAGRQDMFARVPELGTLSQKCVAVIGAGCIGAPSVLEFARAGVGKLHVIDGDFVEPGTVVRWPFGLAAAGKSKVEVLKDFVRSHYPYTEMTCWNHRLGDAIGDQESDLTVVEGFLAHADLVYDASAEIGVNRFMSDMARERKIPFITISTTPGVWGGRVTRIIPSHTEGCWLCLQRATMEDVIPAPPFDARELVQPTGCSTPTFTGASFDATEVSLAGVRTAVSTLCAGDDKTYPGFEWDVAVLSLRDSSGRPMPPTWNTYRLSKHPACGTCRAV